MDAWHYAMIAVLPFLVAPQWRAYRRMGWWALWSPKVRSWWAVMGASLATFIHQDPIYYIALCLIGAILVSAYRMTQWQKFLAWVFFAMIIGNFVFIYSQQSGVQESLSYAETAQRLWEYQYFLSWAMLAAFLAWGGYDGLKRRSRNRAIRRSRPRVHAHSVVG